jgi:hypothetical protein
MYLVWKQHWYIWNKYGKAVRIEASISTYKKFDEGSNGELLCFRNGSEVAGTGMQQ